MNSGAPATAVKAPTGNSVGAATVRAAVSAATSRMAPVSAEPGSSNR